MANYKTIQAQIAKLEKQAARLMNKARADVIAKVKGYIQAHGLTAADLGLGERHGKMQGAAQSRAAPVRTGGWPGIATPKAARRGRVGASRRLGSWRRSNKAGKTPF